MWYGLIAIALQQPNTLILATIFQDIITHMKVYITAAILFHLRK